MTQLFAVHSVYGLVTAVAAGEAGLFAPGEDRLLVPFNSSRVPETAQSVQETPIGRALCRAFDRVEPLNALLEPRHPSAWNPEDDDLPLLRRLLERVWRLEGELELFVQSPQVAPAQTLMAVFPEARITVVGDGLMTYSPIRVPLPRTTVERIGRVVYADVVPGVVPLLFREAGAAAVPVPPERFAAVLSRAAGSDAEADALADAAGRAVPTALVLGQYLSALGLVSPAEEVAMQSELVDRAAQWSPQRIVFKAHPAAPPLVTDAVRDRAAHHGIEFVEYRGSLPAEVLAERVDAVGVVAGFSTALPTVRALFGRPVASAGTAAVLHRLTPYENSNRIPATLVDAMTRDDTPYEAPERRQLLIDAVGYAMQPVIAAHLRPRAVEFLTGLDPAERDRYFSPARLTRLALPGAPPERGVRRALRTVGGVGHWEEFRLTMRGARRRAARAWKAIRGR